MPIIPVGLYKAITWIFSVQTNVLSCSHWFSYRHTYCIYQTSSHSLKIQIWSQRKAPCYSFLSFSKCFLQTFTYKHRSTTKDGDSKTSVVRGITASSNWNVISQWGMIGKEGGESKVREWTQEGRERNQRGIWCWWIIFWHWILRKWIIFKQQCQSIIIYFPVL